MKRSHALLIGALLVLAAIAISAWFYPQLPPRVPTHWDLAGQPNAYSGRLWGAAQFPAFMAMIWLFLLVFPIISPKGFRLDAFLGAFDTVGVGLMSALLIWDVIALRQAISISAQPTDLIFLPIGLMFIIIGNYMGKYRKNFFVGIRTPWTLASDEVWTLTHRFGGWMFMAGGLALMIFSATGANRVAIGVVLGVIVLSPIIYSFVAYRRIEGFGPNGADETDPVPQSGDGIH
jgi:immunity protein, SdpI family